MNYSFVSYKALGDLVIAVTSIERVPAEHRSEISLLYGSHLSPLVFAVAPQFHSKAMPFGDADVPALFDIKKRGMAKAVRSAIAMRRALQAHFRNVDAVAVIDKSGLRETLIMGGLRWTALPSAENIYLAYIRQLASFGLDIADRTYLELPQPRSVGIFAGSRIANKNLPGSVIDKIESTTQRASLHSTLFLLDGERPDLETSGRDHEIIPRSFDRLMAAIESVDLVVSTDSLPAHLAERIGKPVFVLSPRENHYWLPLSSFECGRHALFSDVDTEGQLQRFLAAALNRR